MIRSRFFWAGAILFALIPLLLMDIPKHYIDWERDVRDEMILITQNSSAYTTGQKTQILDKILAGNKQLMALMYLKSFASAILFGLGTYFLYRYFTSRKTSKWKAVITATILLAVTIGAKLYSWTSFAGNQQIVLLPPLAGDTTLANIYNTNFKGKVVYVDFWGTTCGPCLEEFRNFTKPLKQHYKNRKDIAYLYICGGTRLIWKQQLQKFNIEGSHIFLDQKEYPALYHRSVRGSKDSVLAMPRYLIMDKQGVIVDKDAPPPTEKDSIATQLDKYLAEVKK